MSATLTIRDATTLGFGGNDLVWTLDVPAQRMTVHDLIRARVYQEVREYNARQPEFFRGLVQPTDAEHTLNGFRLPKRHQINPETQIKRALDAFGQNGFFMLVDDRQVDDLDQMIEIKPQTSVTFLKLVPLVGG